MKVEEKLLSHRVLLCHITVPGRITNQQFQRRDWTLFKPAAFYPNGFPEKDATNDKKCRTNNSIKDNPAFETTKEHNEVLMGMKLVSVRGDNPNRYGKPTVPATIMLLDAETGEINSLLGATYLTAARTAAGSAIATELCLPIQKNKVIQHLVVFGAGLQAQEHIVAMKCVATVQNITIINRSKERAKMLAAKLMLEPPSSVSNANVHECVDSASPSKNSSIRVVLSADTEEVKIAVRRADVIVTATNSAVPLFQGNWVSPGCHINGVGSYTSDMKEVDEDLVNRCQIFYDAKEALMVGDLKHLQENTKPIRTLLLGDLINNPNFVREPCRFGDCTFYKSVGTAVQDICTAHTAVLKAKELNLGMYVDL
eukprot:CAMPEP_0172421710 /NCGR_PEP_ID=MMETSP1064-20121228/7931_1 /TAXON_ID=202472 /ORGANISM="Aulacoseira subarctica , Strain CCAP 1002/5" /LENGTH=368 /DNA_ID=CAMNT_0013162239 /DNA_START=72 /DNA_END=1177 /DNA_ORIENTATION=+